MVIRQIISTVKLQALTIDTNLIISINRLSSLSKTTSTLALKSESSWAKNKEDSRFLVILKLHFSVGISKKISKRST